MQTGSSILLKNCNSFSCFETVRVIQGVPILGWVHLGCHLNKLKISEMFGYLIFENIVYLRTIGKRQSDTQ